MRNYRRVIETWWDEYKEYFYVSRPESKILDFGDTSVQVQFRKGYYLFYFSKLKHIFKITVHIRSSGLWMRLHMVLFVNTPCHR